MSLGFSKQFFPGQRMSLHRWAAALPLVLFPAAASSADETPVLDRPMEFVLVHGGSAYCDDDGSCAEWISAEGQIFADTPAKLQKMLKTLGGRKLPILVRSPGGDVAAAMQMGTIIRKGGLSVAVGGTHAAGCTYADPLCATGRQKDGSVSGETYSNGAVCLSACPLMLAGGVRRVASPFALVGVHQITTTYNEVRVQYRTEYEMLNGRKKILSQHEVGRKMVGKHDTTKLGAKQKKALIGYLDKMGVDQRLFDLMLSATPQSIRLLTQDEQIELNMTTERSSADQMAIAGVCPREKTLASCIAAAAPVQPSPAAPPAAVPPQVVPPATAPQSQPLPDESEPGMPQPTEQRAGLAGRLRAIRAA